MVAHALGASSHSVTVEIRRMGGGFGGKETQGNQFAAIAAIAAKKLGRAVKIRPDRDDDMIATGQAPRFSRRLRGRVRRRTATFSASTTSMRRVVVSRPTFPVRSPTGRCFTATTPISCRP